MAFHHGCYMYRLRDWVFRRGSDCNGTRISTIRTIISDIRCVLTVWLCRHAGFFFSFACCPFLTTSQSYDDVESCRDCSPSSAHWKTYRSIRSSLQTIFVFVRPCLQTSSLFLSLRGPSINRASTIVQRDNRTIPLLGSRYLGTLVPSTSTSSDHLRSSADNRTVSLHR